VVHAAFQDSPTLVAVDLTDGAPPLTVVSNPASALSALSAPTGERPRLAGRYEIQALVGAGGMGTVYRVRDLELDEVVALKVMRLELLSTPGILERFRREAKLARRVTHQSVARVFDIGEHEGEKFLTMEYVDGESLSTALARDGAFSLGRAVAVGLAVAGGLASAHAAGVVHRDLKPDNVLLSKEGRVVVTDFGIARALVDACAESAGGGAANTLGGFVGTPAYMAPEQVEGRADVDGRADIYAFGALLYEVFTGRRAWPGEAPLAVATARLISPPPDPRAHRPDLPPACAELVLRCLARSPQDRPASFAEVSAELLLHAGAPRSQGAAPTPVRSASATVASSTPVAVKPPRPADTGRAGAHPAEKTVAVLPFRNAGAPDDDYLAEELTDDLLDALSMTRGLKVRPRGAVIRYRGAEVDPRQIGRELGVQVVVEGSVRRARGSVRISARLVSVADGFQIWAKRFDRPEQDVLSINDEAAAAIGEALTLDGRAPPAREAPSDPVAIDLYLRARHEYRKFWPHHLERAVTLFDQALSVAPDDPLLLAGLSLALARLAFFSGAAGIARARQVAERAVAAAPHLGEAYLALGSVLLQSGDAPGAARALRSAVARAPGLAEAHGALGRILCEAGAVDEGLRRLEAAHALDPDMPLVLPELVRVYALVGRWDRSEEILAGYPVDAAGYWTLRTRTAMWRRDPALIASCLARISADAEGAQFPRLLLEVLHKRPIPGEISPDDRPPRVVDLAEVERDLSALAVASPIQRAESIEQGTSAPDGAVRRHAFVLQLRAEVLCFFGHHAAAIEAVRRCAEVGLVDRFWLERCPLLDEVRKSESFPAILGAVARRTDAILDAYRSA
jgi:serine/threonine-protein kinase